MRLYFSKIARDELREAKAYFKACHELPSPSITFTPTSPEPRHAPQHRPLT